MKKILAVQTEVYSRVVGFYRDVNGWNPGKQQEFKERQYLQYQQQDVQQQQQQQQ